MVGRYKQSICCLEDDETPHGVVLDTAKLSRAFGQQVEGGRARVGHMCVFGTLIPEIGPCRLPCPMLSASVDQQAVMAKEMKL